MPLACLGVNDAVPVINTIFIFFTLPDRPRVDTKVNVSVMCLCRVKSEPIVVFRVSGNQLWPGGFGQKGLLEAYLGGRE